MGRTARSVTLSVTIDAPYEVAFAYLSDGRHAAEWAINFLKEVREADGGLTVVTPFGEQPYIVRADLETGVVDQVIGDTTSAARLVPNAEGVDYLFTLQQPAGMPDDAFDGGVRGLREELDTLKNILESSR